MGRVIVDLSPSVDGYVAGNGVTVDMPFGDAGHRLHRWLGFEACEPTAADRAAAAGMLETAGAVVIGRRMFDVGIDRWGEDGAFCRPCFVVTHRPMYKLQRGPTSFEFVNESVARVLAMARAAAGDRDVIIAGGADIAQQCLAAGLVDELRLHVVPVLLGGGTPLFKSSSLQAQLEVTQVIESPNATHLTFKVLR